MALIQQKYSIAFVSFASEMTACKILLHSSLNISLISGLWS